MTVLTQKDAAVFIQFRLGDKSYYLGDCVDLDTIPNPRLGGIEYIYCWRSRRDGFRTVGKKYSPPDAIEVTLGKMLEETQGWLDQVTCPFTLYALKRNCGEAGVFKNWVRGSIVYNAEITGDEIGSFGHHVDDNESTQDFTIVAAPPRVDVWKLTASRISLTQIQPANCVAVAGNIFCDDACGEYTTPCDVIVAGTDAGAGTADVLRSLDAGTSFAALASDPFAAALNIFGIAIFEISKGVNRILVARGTLAATAMSVAFSDDGGATWTLSTVGATLTEAATGPKSLFALDSEHIWLGTDQGNVFFSADGGASWTNQNALGATGGSDVNAISFCDENYGFAVCDGDDIIKTVDGGDHWTAATATGSGDDLLSVVCFSQNRVLVGTNSAGAATSLYMSYDGGATWEARSYTGSLTELTVDMDFINQGVGMLISNTAGPVGSLHMTIDGGYTWEEIVVPTNSGFNAIVMCNPKTAYVVGELNTTTFIMKVGV